MSVQDKHLIDDNKIPPEETVHGKIHSRNKRKALHTGEKLDSNKYLKFS